MIPQPKALYLDKGTDSYLRIFHIIPESRLYYSSFVTLEGKILNWPTEAFTFDHFNRISQNFELQFKDPMRPKETSDRESDIAYGDNIISIMKEIVDKNEPIIYFKGMRNQIVQKWREDTKDEEGNYKYGTSTLYGFIEKYIACGRHANLFVPLYENCGLRGVDKTPGEQKLGRPVESEELDDLILTDDDKVIIQKSYKENANKLGISGAYERMKLEHYRKKKKKPSYSQFYYWGDKLNCRIEKLKDKAGSIIYNKDLRPLTGTSRQDYFGPGSEFMMDATKDNTYVVSLKFQHKYLGRCTLYLVVDVFSAMVTGFTLTPDNASYYNAALALYNVGTTKVDLFKELELDHLTYEDWPCDYMPCRILCDKGPEFISYMSESIPNNLEIELNNTPPYRPDLKGIVEVAIKCLLDNIEGLLYGNGLIKKGPSRITKDARKEAIFNYKDMMKIIVLEIIKHNNTKPIEGYKRTPEMISDNVPTIPLHLWNWGISNGLGSLRRFEKQELWIRLLPTEKDVSFNKEGYLFKKDRWINTDKEGELLREFLLASKAKGDTVTVSYNPTNIKETYLLHEKKFYPIALKSNQDFLNLFELEVEDKNKSEVNAVYERQAQEFKEELSSQQLGVVEDAKKRSNRIRGKSPAITNGAQATKEESIKEYHKEKNDQRTNASENSTDPSTKESPKTELVKPNRVALLMNIQKNVN